MKVSKKKVAAGLAAGAITLTGAGVAYAYWSSTGTGTGSATTGSADNSLSITDTTSITDLAPGVAAESISGKIKNTSPTQSEYVNTVTVTIDSVDETPAAIAAFGDPTDNSHRPGTSGSYYVCSASDYDLANPVMDVQQDLTHGQEVTFTGATLGFHDSTSNQDACQGATVNLAYSSN